MERLIDHLWQELNLPDTTQLNSRIYKKTLLDSVDLSSADKKVINEDIDTLIWRNTLKPETINIPKLESNELDYPEIAIIQVALKESNPSEKQNSDRRIQRLVELIQRAIPYPLLLVITINNRLWLSLANKRQSLADHQKLTVESFFNSHWIDGDRLLPIERDFLNTLKIDQLDWGNYYRFYQGLVNRLVALQAARHTGQFQLESPHPERANENSGTPSGRQSVLREIEQLEEEYNRLRGTLKKESQFNRRLTLNMQIKQCQQQIQRLTDHL